MPHQTDSVLGSYRLLEPLGHGGMGVVWRAVHQVSGQHAALKTVRVLDEALLACIRREIHALARIRHPGIVRILEEGVHEGLPWYAMELLEGQSLRLHWAAHAAGPAAKTGVGPLAQGAQQLWWTQTLAPQARLAGAGLEPARSGEALPAPGAPIRGTALHELLSLMRRLCAPLAFLHGEGIVHRDLKPDNILVRPAGAPPGIVEMPVLVDFGLAAQFGGEGGRESLEWPGGVSGTVAYMAPEQIRGELVDARADLYSFGCILYELITGRPPFSGRSFAEAAAAHLSQAPEPPSRFVPGLPPQLEALILQLLRKDPRERLGYADDVARALERLGAEDGLAEAGPKPRTYLYRPGFGGRQPELSSLERRLEGLASAGGALVLVGGESGIGKTRLALELARRAAGGGAQVLLGETPPPGQEAGPLGALRRPLQQLADRCRARGQAETERLLGRRGKVLAQYEPALRELPGQEAYPEPARLSAESARLRVFSYLAETLEALASAAPGAGPAAAPVLLVLDDLQWADDLTLGFLRFLLDGGFLERLPLLVLGTYRSEEVGAGLRELSGSPRVQDLALDRLDEAAVGSMVGRMLALEPPPRVLSRHLTLQSEGNPFFVAEYLRTAVEEGLLGRDEQGIWQVAGPASGAATEADYAALPLPRSLRALVRRRLSELPGPAQAVLEAACVLGREMSLLVLERMGGAPPGGLDTLLRRQVLEEARAAGGAPGLRFAHDKLREVAYEQLTPQRRAALHRLAAKSLGASAGLEGHSAVLGHHWEQAGALPEARECYLAAARQAADSLALAEAERLYQAFLRVTPEPGLEKVGVRLALGFGVLHILGRNPEAEAELGQALHEAMDLGDRASESMARSDLGWICELTGRLAEAEAFQQDALRIARELGDAKIEAQSLGRLARLMGDRGRLEEARILSEQALVLCRQQGNRRGEATTLDQIAQFYHDLGLAEPALDLLRQAVAIAREVGDRQLEASYLGNMGVDYALEERWPETGFHYEQALAVFREIGHRRGEAVFTGNLAHLRLYLGEPEQARRLYARAFDLHQSTGSRAFQARMLWELSRLERLCGPDPASGQPAVDPGPLVQQAEALARTVGHLIYLGLSLYQRGHYELASGRSAEPALAELRPLAASLHLAPKSELSQSLGRLERAQQAFEAGEWGRLFRGEVVEDIPEGLRRWLVETGRLEAQAQT